MSMRPEPGALERTSALPTGTVTFLFSDIEGSTQRWETHREAMKAALARHEQVMSSAIKRHGGYVFKTIGDAFCAAFPTAPDALTAAVDGQLALARRRGKGSRTASLTKPWERCEGRRGLSYLGS